MKAEDRMEKGYMVLKEMFLEAIPCLFRQSSKTKVMAHVVPSNFQLPQENKSFQLCRDQKVDEQQWGQEEAEQKFMPQTKTKVFSLDFAYRRATYIGGAVLRCAMAVKACKDFFFMNLW